MQYNDLKNDVFVKAIYNEILVYRAIAWEPKKMGKR